MTSNTSTINIQGAYSAAAEPNNRRPAGAAVPASRRKAVRSARVSRNVFRLIAIAVTAIFLLIGLSAYAASIQHSNNILTQENEYLQAEIDSLNSQIVEQTKVTKVEEIATTQYGMVYPTDENCILISEDADPVDTLAATIRSEAYN